MSLQLNLSNFKLTYDDEFNSFTSSPDGSSGYKTTFYFGGRSLPSNGELEFYSDSTVGVNPFSLSNGALQITASPGSNPDGLPYNSGIITTQNMFHQTYGYFETREEMAQGPGMWSAFWLLPDNKSWPPEIDPLEAFGATNANGEGGIHDAHHGVIPPDMSYTQGSWATVLGDNITTSYHTYGVDWEPDTITWYIDGQQVYEVGQINTPPGLDIPMYMLTNLAVGGWGGNPVGETSVLSIDYIRAYSKNPNATAVALQTISSPDVADTTPYGATDANGVILSPAHIVIRASQDAWDGDDAKFTVMVGGHQIDGVSVVTASHSAGQWQDIVVDGFFDVNDEMVTITFLNDAGGPGTAGRNLYIQSISFNGDVISGTDAQNNAANGEQALDPTAAVMTVNGTANFFAILSTIHLSVSEDAWNGDAKFVVLVDGNQIEGVQTVNASHSAGQWQDIALSGYFNGGEHVIDVNFINDGWGDTASTDRNMYIQSIDVNGEVIAGSTAQNNAASGQESLDPAAAVMAINGTAAFTSGGNNSLHLVTLNFSVSEDAWNGDAHFTVTVDGSRVDGIQTVSASHSGGQWQDIGLASYFADGPHVVGVNFINDGWGGSTSADRNMYIRSIDVNGEIIAGNLALNNAAGGAESLDPHAAVMAINGSAYFTTTGIATPPLLSTLVLNVSEDAWNGDALFTVTVDGVQVGDVQTTTASHALHQVQNITLTGDFGSLGPDKIDLSFLNDGWGGSAATDRNLYIQSIDVNGVHFAGNAAHNNAAAGEESLDLSAAVMAINGTAEFDIHHTAPLPELMG